MNKALKLRLLSALIALPMLGGCLSQMAQPTGGGGTIDRMLAGESAMQGKALEQEVADAEQNPLGSEQNPVRASMPEGQRAYLARLRCDNGRAPEYSRVGSMGPSRYGNIMDGYRLVCEGSEPAESVIYMDMYHSGHVEIRPVPGFTIVAP